MARAKKARSEVSWKSSPAGCSPEGGGGPTACCWVSSRCWSTPAFCPRCATPSRSSSGRRWCCQKGWTGRPTTGRW